MALFATNLCAQIDPVGESAAVRVEHVTVQLVSDVASVQPGKPFIIALRILHDPGWHTYWMHSTTGYHPDITWDLPDGWSDGTIQWPVPRVYMTAHIVDYVFEGETLFPVAITPPDSWREGSITIRGKVEWLMCADICIPGEVDLALTLPVSNTAPVPHQRWSEPIAEVMKELPHSSESWEMHAYRSEESVWLHVIPHSKQDLIDDPYFFTDNGYVELQEHQDVIPLPSGGWLFSLRRAPDGPRDAARLTGVIASASARRPDGAPHGITVDVPIESEIPAVVRQAPSEDLYADGFLGLTKILGFAFLGGLILNLMPCVFPVLGLKIMSFAKQAGESRTRIVLHGLIFTLGILISFWILVAVISILRAAGESLGWGFQLQSPVFVFWITILLFVFALNLSGLFEFGQSAVGIGAGLANRSGLLGSFFGGIFATVVATPCAAPFLAPALGAAFAMPPVQSWIVFTVIGLGFAAPYLILSAYPRMIQLLPRPGSWMVTLRQALAFPMYATVGYLLWVMSGQMTEAQFGQFGFLLVFLGLAIVALGFWVYGRYSGFERSENARNIGRVAAACLIIAGTTLAYPNSIDHDDPLTVHWEEWSPDTVAAFREQDRIIYIDFTARWCTTCQTNKAAVFGSDEVRQRFKNLDIVALRADWTSRDPRIAAELARFGRSAIPFNIIYTPDIETPIVLPALLTPGIVLRALEDL